MYNHTKFCWVSVRESRLLPLFQSKCCRTKDLLVPVNPMIIPQIACCASGETCHFFMAAFARKLLYLDTSSANMSLSLMSVEVALRSSIKRSKRMAVFKMSFRCLSAPCVESCRFSKLTRSASLGQDTVEGMLNISCIAGRNGSSRSLQA